ncbi:MAG TPA: heavy metal-associated domain-containing protein [Trueperaceae bacterium]
MTKLKIEGMSCGHCRQAVQNALESVPGSQDVQVDLEQGLATVDGQPEVALLVAAVENEGYRASVLS